MENVFKNISGLQGYLVEYGLKLMSAILILVIGLWLVKMVMKVFNKSLIKKEVDPTLVKFFTTLTRVALIAFVIIAAISKVGVETTSFVALIGAAGLAVGLALQGSLSNFASGIMLIIFRPIKVDDFIEGGGIIGFVEEIGIFVTVIRTVDNRIGYVPNSKLTSDNIVNFTSRGTRRVDLVFGIGYGENIDKAKEAVHDVLSKNTKILKDPKPDVLVKELADSSVNLAVRPWCKSNNYWEVYFEVTESVKKKFDELKIQIPFPQRDVHIHQS